MKPDYEKAWFDLFDLIKSDAYAMTFQSLGQYRGWLLQSMDKAASEFATSLRTQEAK